MPGINPPNSDALWTMLRNLQQQVQAMSRQQQAAYTDGQGRPVVFTGLLPGSNPPEYGFFVYDAENGVRLGSFGALPQTYNRSDGSAQPGFALFREDGSLAVFLGDLNPTTPPYKQSFQVMDRSNHVVIADDTNGGQGIALPYLAWPAPVSVTAPSDTTTSASFVTLQSTVSYWMNPKIVGQILVQSSDSATTGVVQVVDGSSNVLASVNVTGNQFSWVTFGPVAMPGTFGSSVALNFQAKRTAGTGTIGLRALAPIGVQS